MRLARGERFFWRHLQLRGQVVTHWEDNQQHFRSKIHVTVFYRKSDFQASRQGTLQTTVQYTVLFRHTL